MAVRVYRCAHCGREVLVRVVQPLTEAEIARRIEEELRPAAPGAHGRAPIADRLRDDIWAGISGAREIIPREALPERCPSCHRSTLRDARLVEG